MKKSNILPIFCLGVLVVFYLPFTGLLPPDYLGWWIRAYMVVDPFILMPVFIGAMSLYIISKDYKNSVKIISLLVYGLSLMASIFIMFFVQDISLKTTLIHLAFHILIIGLSLYVARSGLFKDQ